MEAGIVIVGSVGGGITVTDRDVRLALSGPVRLNHDTDYRGKTSTQLFASDSHVLKMKPAFALAREQAEKWCQAQLRRERHYAIYPPHRHWVVLEQQGQCTVANITSKGRTLESLLLAALAENREDLAGRWFAALFRHYFRFWQQHGLRQDEGLTNYIVEDGSEDAVLHYIDDDIYSTDNLISLAHSLGALLRRLDISEALARRMASDLFAEMRQVDRMLPAVLAEQMREVFLPQGREALRSAMLEILERQGEHASRRCADRVAVLADVHGNLPALQAVLADMEASGLHQAVVLGDIVGYGPFPGECIDLLRQRNWLVLRGNHDHAAACGEPGMNFNALARWSLEWTTRKLSAGQREWLEALPLVWRDGDLYAVHGAPVDPTFFNGYVYTATASRNLDVMQEKGLRLCFHGHSHMAGAFRRNVLGIDERLLSAVIELDARARYLICPGSVGQPRDGGRGAQYAIFDRECQRVEFRDIPYDRAALLGHMCGQGFPERIIRHFQPETAMEEA